MKALFAKLLSVVIALSLLSGALTNGAPAQAQDSGAERAISPETGMLTFYSGGINPLGVEGVAASAIAGAEGGLAVIEAMASDLGLSDPINELSVRSERVTANGRTVTRYQQHINGVPVLAGEIIVNASEEGLLSLSSKISPFPSVDTTPALTPEEAQQAAIVATAKQHDVSMLGLSASEPELWVYDPRLIGAPEARVQPIWWVTVSGAEGDKKIREVVFVNAHTGTISLNYSLIHDHPVEGQKVAVPETVASARETISALAGGTPLVTIYDMRGSNNDALLPSPTNSVLCTESNYGNPSTCAADYTGSSAEANAALNGAIETYNFFYTRFGRDSFDDNGDLEGNGGIRTVISINYGVNYANAFWDGDQMAFGDNMTADDIVAHEWVHALTDYEARLIYWGQPGAINESMSDIFGEFVDQTNGRGNDTAEVKWLLGEDSGYVFRDMANPPRFGQPNSMTHALYYLGFGDNAGVHYNSGVGNKAAHLMVEGGTFNNVHVVALGLEKTAAIYYEALTNLLGAGSTYMDLYYILPQACYNLVGESVHGGGTITAFDCKEVRDAVTATRMSQTRSATVYPVADYCLAGMSHEAYTQSGNTKLDPARLFKDDFEDGANKWVFSKTIGTEDWKIFDGGYGASSQQYYLYAKTPPNSADKALMFATMKDPVSLPLGQRYFLRFNHDRVIEPGFDGGYVQYSLNGGGTWRDMHTLYSAGVKPTFVLNSTNPTPSKYAFGGASVNYTSTVFDLTSLAGRNVLFRWVMSGDTSVESWWAIDDVEIYRCLGVPNRPAYSAPASNAAVTTLTPTLKWSASAPDLYQYDLQVSTTSNFAAPLIEKYDLTTNSYTVTLDDGLERNTLYYWRIRSRNALEQTVGWTAPRTFKTTPAPTALTYPPLPSGIPLTLSTINTTSPIFDWEDVDGATRYLIQASLFANYSEPFINVQVTNSEYQSPRALPQNRVIYWRVQVRGLNGASSWATGSFRTPLTPSVPVPVVPANNGLVDIKPRFDWSDITVPAGVTFDKYELQISTDTSFNAPEYNIEIGSSDPSEYTLGVSDTALSRNTVYRWRVRACDDSIPAICSGWSAVRTVRVQIETPVVLSPSATPDSPRPFFDWNDSSGANQGYTIQISRDPLFKTVLITVNTTAATSHYILTQDLPQNTQIHWRVRARGTNGPSLWVTQTFTTPIAPAMPAIASPANNALLTTLTPVLDWADSVLPDGQVFSHYELQVADEITFANPIIDIGASDQLAVSAYTVLGSDNLQPNMGYHWRVRVCNTNSQCSGWNTRSFRMIIPQPVLLAPANAAVLNTSQPIFTWEAAPGSGVRYNLQVATTSNFASTSIVINTTISTTEFMHSGQLLPNRLYYWRIRAIGANGPSAFSTTRSFTTPNPPSRPALTAPARNSVVRTLTPKIDWSTSTLPTGVAFGYYELQVNTSRTFDGTMVLELDNLTNRSASEYTFPSDLDPNTTYHWRVRACSATNQCSAWMSPSSFRTPYVAPTLLTPANGVYVETRLPYFDWEDIPGATAGYTIQISRNNTFTLLVSTVNVKTSEYRTPTNLPLGTLYWRVQVRPATGINGPGLWSETRMLVINP
jgi:bacillolysin